MGNWAGLPPIDVGGWAEFQRRRLQQEAAQRIAAAGATAQDWGAQAQRQIDQITSGLTSGLQGVTQATQGGPQDVGAAIGAAMPQVQGQFSPPNPLETDMPDIPSFPEREGAGLPERVGVRFANEAIGSANWAGDPAKRSEFGSALANVLPYAGIQGEARGMGYPAPPQEQQDALIPQVRERARTGEDVQDLARVLEGAGHIGNLAPVPVEQAQNLGYAALSEGLEETPLPEWAKTGAAMAGSVALGAGLEAPAVRSAVADLPYRFGVAPDDALGIVKKTNYDPTGVHPERGRLAARGKPGRAPGWATPWEDLTEEERLALEAKGIDFEKYNTTRSADPIPPGPEPGGEYAIEHPTLGTLRSKPPEPNSWLTSDGIIFWKRVQAGLSPYKANWERTQAALKKGRYPWDPFNEPPPAPGEPGYGRLPGLGEQPLAAPDWDAKLAGWAPKRGTDPVTLRHLLNRYATQERFPWEAVEDLAPSHPDLATPEAQKAALADLQDALIKSKTRRSQNEDRAIQSERNVRKTRAKAEEEGADPTKGDGTFSYTSEKGVTPDGEVGGEFHLTSSYEVASAMKFDLDPEVVSYQKGAGPRGRVRVGIDPKYGYNPTSEALMANSDPGPGSEVIYSPDWLLNMRDGTQRVVETKNAGIVHIPAWRIEAKTSEGQRHFEDLWGAGFMMMAEDQIGRPFMRELGEADLSKLPAGHPLLRIRATDVADFQKKMRSAWKASRGGVEDPQTLANAQHIADLNSSSKYPPPASLDESVNVQQYMSAGRAQAEWNRAAPDDGWTFSVDEQGIPLAPGLGGHMVPVTPENRRITYPTHYVPGERIAQFRHENADLFEAFPDARVTTRKWTNKGKPQTTLEVSVRVADGRAAAEVANLFRSPVVYTIDSSTTVPVRRAGMVGAGEYDLRGRIEQLRRIDAEATTRALGGDLRADFPEYRSRGGRVAPTFALPPRARPPARGGPGGAAAGRGAGVPGLSGEGAGAAGGPGPLAGAGVPEPDAGGLVPPPAAGPLAQDGGRSGGVGIARGAGAGGPAAGPSLGGAFRGAVASLQPYGAATTGGQRAFDLASGTAGGVAGALTADEDATWEERARRAIAGTVAGSLAGPTARGGLGLARRGAPALPEEVISKSVALGLPGGTRGLQDPLLREAVANSGGALRLTEEGLDADLIRLQRSGIGGTEAGRRGVYYSLKNLEEALRRTYGRGASAFGGEEFLEGETLLQRPLVIPEGSGTTIPPAVFARLRGTGPEGLMKFLYSHEAYSSEEGLAAALREIGARDPERAAQLVFSVTDPGGARPSAIRELVVGELARQAGHDSIVGVNPQTRVAQEVFDLREANYPIPGQEGTLLPDVTERSTPPSGGVPGEAVAPERIDPAAGMFGAAKAWIAPDGTVTLVNDHPMSVAGAGGVEAFMRDTGAVRLRVQANGQALAQAEGSLTPAQTAALGRVVRARGGDLVFDLPRASGGRVSGAGMADFARTLDQQGLRGTASTGNATDRSMGIVAGAGAPGGPSPSGGVGRAVGGALTRIPELISAIPLAAPTSLVANLTGGMARSLERVAGVAFEGRPVDALVDAGAMVRSLVSGEALRAGGKAFKAGPTEANPGMTGAVTPDDLLASKNRLAQVATGGVRANAATDQFWRALNEAGAGAQARRRGMSADEAGAYATRAGDFATFTGTNSVVAKKLTEMKQTVRDPSASFLDKAVAGSITSMAPYVMMPERLLRATIGALVPAESAAGFARAVARGDKAAAREYAGRAMAGMAATTALTYHYFNGGITGDRPEDANEARRREARGERWNTIETPAGRVPSRFLGSLGMQANAIATTLDAARRAQEKGGDPGAVIENGFNGAARWFLDASYLSDLSEFGADVQGPEGAAGALRNVAAGLPSRVTGPVTGAIGARDPYEREAEGFPEQVMMRTGLRSQLPARIDPTTGGPQERRGSGWDRYWGTRGSEQTPEGSELARLRVTPRVIGRTEEYLGAVRSREDRRKVQQVLGSETNRTVRRTINAPYYQKGTDLQKKGYLEDAIREASRAAQARLWKMGIRPAKKTDAELEAELDSEF